MNRSRLHFLTFHCRCGLNVMVSYEHYDQAVKNRSFAGTEEALQKAGDVKERKDCDGKPHFLCPTCAKEYDQLVYSQSKAADALFYDSPPPAQPEPEEPKE